MKQPPAVRQDLLARLEKLTRLINDKCNNKCASDGLRPYDIEDILSELVSIMDTAIKESL